MEIRDLSPTVLTIGVVEMNPGAERSGTIERVERYQMLKFFGTQIAHERTHRTAFELEDAQRFTPLEHLVHGRIVQCNVIDVDAFTGVAINLFESTFDRCEGAQT
ncbi:hypothetical protein BMS3Bbin02_01454 [bacterium BMS3Bbin02]|nr:hypothetical protein BMS3Bbin02_01454 [bacterium BMS3Bbin02]